MEYRNCPSCGAVFAYIKSPICKNCEVQEEKDLDVLKEFIRENPGTNVYEASKATGIRDRRILRYVKEGRLELVKPGDDSGVKCERCGKAIIKGRICESCLIKQNKQIQEMLSKNVANQEPLNENTSKARMHTYKKKP